MKLSIATILDFVLLTILVLICAGNIGMHLNTQAARNFHAQAVDEVENSNFSDGVIQGLEEEATNMGYVMTIKKYQVNDKNVAEVTLDYKYSIPLLNIVNAPETIRGTAR